MNARWWHHEPFCVEQIPLAKMIGNNQLRVSFESDKNPTVTNARTESF